MKCRIAMGLTVLIITAFGARADDSRRDEMPPSQIRVDRRIDAEPVYIESPMYCLLLFGQDGATGVWIIEDGNRLFVDRNANGDLTDDGEPVTGHQHPEFRSTFEYQIEPLSLASGDLQISRLTIWRSQSRDDRKDINYSVLATINSVAQSGGWKPIFAEKPEDASVLHLGGALQPRPYRRKTLRLFPPEQELSIAFSTPGMGEQFPVSLANDAVSLKTQPSVAIDWPSVSGANLRTYHNLTHRQCYWEFTETITAPDDATTGTARIEISFPTDLPIILESYEFEMNVTARDKNRRRQRWIQP